MKRKQIETPDEMMDYIQEYVLGLMNCEKESLMENIEEWDDFQKGQSKGAYMAYDEIYAHLRNLLKHGYDHLTVDDYSDLCGAPESE
jgi:hypothetical protein